MSTAALARDVKSTQAPKARARESGLRVNQPGDIYEREAENVAEQVMAGPARKAAWSLSRISLAPPLQRECSCGGNCDECQKKKDEMLQRDAFSAAVLASGPSSVNEVLRQPGHALDLGTREFMESRFGYDFGRVRIFDDESAARSAQAVSANAYTVGEKIVFNRGRYAPASRSGQRLLAHELTHVVQQGAARPVGAQPSGDWGVQRSATDDSVLGHATLAITEMTGTPMLQCDPDPLLTADAAGGCGVCLGGDLRDVGNTAHTLIKTEFEVEYPFMLPEFPINSPDNTIINKGRPDLAMGTKTGIKVGEIKPANPEGYIEGEAKLVIYEKLFKAAFPKSTFERMDLPPVPPTEFVDPIASMSGCRPQMLVTSPNVRGVYGYLCTPPFKELVKECKCNRDPKPIPLPETEKKKVDEKDKKKVDQQRYVPDLTPVYAAAGMAALSFLASKVLPKLGGKALGPIYAALSLAAMALMLAEGKAEAKVGPGEKEPLQQLFESMAQQGVQVPPDVQALIENNPELKAKVEKAMAKGGDPSDAEKAINEQMLKVIEAHKDELSEEELGILLDCTRAAGPALPQDAATEEKILKAIKDKKAAGSGQGTGDGAAASPADKPDGGPKAATDGGSKETDGAGAVGKDGDNAPKADGAAGAGGLTQAGRQKIAGAPEPVRTLFNAITAGSGPGTSVTDATVDQYLSIVPGDLTADEAKTLSDRLAASAGKSTADILESLRKGVAELRGGNAAAQAPPADPNAGPAKAAGDAPTGGKPDNAPKGDTKPGDSKQVDPKQGESKQGAAPKDKQAAADALHTALAKLAASGDYSAIHAGQYQLTWGDIKDPQAELLYIDQAGVRSAAYVKGRVVRRDDTKKQAVVSIVSISDLVAADGSVQPMTLQLIGKNTTLRIIAN